MGETESGIVCGLPAGWKPAWRENSTALCISDITDKMVIVSLGTTSFWRARPYILAKEAEHGARKRKRERSKRLAPYGLIGLRPVPIKNVSNNAAGEHFREQLHRGLFQCVFRT
jgi:hypothetical protein